MDESILSWNITNWITVVIMAALGFMLLALVAQIFHKGRGTGGHSQYSTTPQTSTMV